MKFPFVKRSTFENLQQFVSQLEWDNRQLVKTVHSYGVRLRYEVSVIEKAAEIQRDDLIKQLKVANRRIEFLRRPPSA